MTAGRTWMGRRAVKTVFNESWIQKQKVTVNNIEKDKVHIFWEGHTILQNLYRRFDRYYIGQIYGGDFA